jgi:16S rRNA C1402 (ribose-2'-O) methylase RsmI
MNCFHSIACFSCFIAEDQTDTERLLSRYISYKEKLELENEKLLTKIRMLQELCEKKEYIIQVSSYSLIFH